MSQWPPKGPGSGTVTPCVRSPGGVTSGHFRPMAAGGPASDGELRVPAVGAQGGRRDTGVCEPTASASASGFRPDQPLLTEAGPSGRPDPLPSLVSMLITVLFLNFNYLASVALKSHY